MEVIIRSVPSGYGIDPHDPERFLPLMAIEHMASEKVETTPRASLEEGLKPFVRAPTIDDPPAPEQGRSSRSRAVASDRRRTHEPGVRCASGVKLSSCLPNFSLCSSAASKPSAVEDPEETPRK
jgi:hypothetical protein